MVVVVVVDVVEGVVVAVDDEEEEEEEDATPLLLLLLLELLDRLPGMPSLFKSASSVLSFLFDVEEDVSKPPLDDIIIGDVEEEVVLFPQIVAITHVVASELPIYLLELDDGNIAHSCCITYTASCGKTLIGGIA